LTSTAALDPSKLQADPEIPVVVIDTADTPSKLTSDADPTKLQVEQEIPTLPVVVANVKAAVPIRKVIQARPSKKRPASAKSSTTPLPLTSTAALLLDPIELHDPEILVAGNNTEVIEAIAPVENVVEEVDVLPIAIIAAAPSELLNVDADPTEFQIDQEIPTLPVVVTNAKVVEVAVPVQKVIQASPFETLPVAVKSPLKKTDYAVPYLPPASVQVAPTAGIAVATSFQGAPSGAGWGSVLKVPVTTQRSVGWGSSSNVQSTRGGFGGFFPQIPSQIIAYSQGITSPFMAETFFAPFQAWAPVVLTNFVAPTMGMIP
jgi:hypothetical protein